MKEKIKKYTIYIIPILIVITILILIQQKEEPITENIIEPIEKVEIPKEENIKEIKKIKIDIKGEVNNPGVYELDEGSRVSDAIKASNGLTENADTTLINLSKNLIDEMVIIIYNKYEIEKLKEDLTTTQTVIKYIEKECTCPDTINDACIKKSDIKDSPEKEQNEKEISDGKISLNKALLEELKTIPGIGESKAKAIIEYREKNNGFKTIEEIKNISGIGEATFEKLKEYITI